MPRTLEIAMQTAISRKGVAVVVIPGDTTFKEATAQQPRLRFRPTEPLLRPSEKDLSNLASTLDANEKVTILAGAGCAGAHTELINLAERLKAPIVHALRGKEFIEYDKLCRCGQGHRTFRRSRRISGRVRWSSEGRLCPRRTQLN
jgi:pyruvate dehydrogenase (quinone)